jgi:hypothetical protein
MRMKSKILVFIPLFTLLVACGSEKDGAKDSIPAREGYAMRELWHKKEYGISTSEQVSFEVPPHGVVVLSIEGTSIPFNVFQKK